MQIKLGSFSLDKKKIAPLLIPVVILLIIITTSLLFLKPKIGQILEIQKKLSSEKTKLAQLTAKVASLQGLDEVELGEKTQVVLSALPPEKNIPLSLATIRSLVTTSGLELRGVQADPGEIASQSAEITMAKKYNLGFLEFRVSVSGNLNQVKDFLSKIETTIPLMRIDDIEFIQSAAQATETIDSNLIINTFFLPLPTTLGASEKPLLSITNQEEEIYKQLLKFKPAYESTSFGSAPSGKENPFTF